MGKGFLNRGRRNMEDLKQDEKGSFGALEQILYDGAQLYEHREIQEEKRLFIIFRLLQNHYSIESSKIKEILKRSKITPLPFSPPFISGVTTFRGNILSVTDLKRILGLAREEDREGMKVIVVESRTMETGILVDEVIDSVEVSVKQIEPLPEEKKGVLEGVWRWGERWVGMVCVENVIEKGRERRDEDPTIRNLKPTEEIF